MTAISAWHATEGLSSREVCERVGITYRQLDYWCRIGIIEASVHQAGGGGTARRFSEDDVRQCAAIRAVGLAVDGRRKHEFRAIVKSAAVAVQRPGARWLVITDDGTVTCGAGELERIAEGGGIVVDLGAARA